MTPPNPASGSRSPVSLAVVLLAAAAVGFAYAAAALAWRAGYAPRLGTPLWEPTDVALLAVRCGLVVGAGGLVVLALYGRRRAALGAALVLVVCAPAGAGPVYSPAAGLRWSVQLARTAGVDSPVGALAVQAWAAGGLLALALLAAVTTPPRPVPSPAHGTATWGDGEGLADAEAGLLLGRQSGRAPEVGYAVQARAPERSPSKVGPLLRYDGPGHVLTVAPTRAGKGIGAVIPTLLDHPGPVLVTDPKGENLALTARYRAGVLGHHVVALDPFELTPPDLPGHYGAGSITVGGLNPLDLIDPGHPDQFEDAALLAEMLVVDEGGGDNRFWVDEARALLAGLVLHVAQSERDDRRSLLTVREMLTAGPDAFEKVMNKMADEKSSVAVRRTASRIAQKHDKERSAVMSTAQSHTHFLDSGRMEGVLKSSTFAAAALRAGGGDRPLSVYLLLPPDRLDAFSRWLRLSVATAIAALAKLGPLKGRAPGPSRRTLLLLDEFAQLGPMPPVRRALTLMAGYGVQVWPFLQDLGQLRRLYPKDWESFVANSDALQAFGTTDQFTAEYLSKMAGTATVFHHSQSASRNRGKNASRSAGSGASETARPLITPDELRRLGRADQLVLVRGEDPVLARRIAYYADPTFAGRVARADGVPRRVSPAEQPTGRSDTPAEGAAVSADPAPADTTPPAEAASSASAP